VVNSCLEHSIGRIIFGWNQGQKQECNLGKVNNQSFVFIPTDWMGMSYLTMVKNPTGGEHLGSE
ncbi:hypothetical protein NW863_08525, partial [Synechococcus sp. B60.1]